MTRIVATDVVNSSQPAVDAFNSSITQADKLDRWVLYIFLGMVLALIITSWFVAGRPVFGFLYMIVIIIGVGLSAILSNVWETTTIMARFGAAVGSFPITNHLLSYLPIYTLAVGFIGMVVMFAKPQ